MVREIPLSYGKVAIVDDEDFPELSTYRWRCRRAPRKWSDDTWYAFRRVGRGGGKRSCIAMHRQILQLPAGVDADHRDGDGLNNARRNLRPCNDSQNAANRKPKKLGVTSSSFRGVTWHRRCGKWQAQIELDGRSLYLGIFSDEEDAARAYDEAARRLFGDFAKPNFSSSGELP